MKVIVKESQFLRVIEETSGGSNKSDRERFIQKAQEIHNDNGVPKYDYSLVDYVDSNTKVKVICPKHKDNWLKKTGNEYFEVLPNKHLQGQGCRFDYLESKLKYSEDELTQEASKYSTTAEFKRNSPLHFYASIKKGNDFFKKITSHFTLEKESSGEKLVAKILVDNGLIDEKCLSSKKCENREKIFEDCRNTKKGKLCLPLRFDFYLPNINTIVEFDGEQHFKPSSKFGQDKFVLTQQNDRIKNEFCRKNNINLIRIHYRVPAEQVSQKLIDSINNPKPLTLIGDYSSNNNTSEE